MKFYYLSLIAVSFVMPFVFSFIKRVNFYAHKRALFSAIIISAALFLVWDILFTRWGVWGFNPKFHLGILLFNLPLEEILFFLCVPFACLFIHASLLVLQPISLPEKATKWLVVSLSLFLVLLAAKYHNRLYTFTVAIYTLTILNVAYFICKIKWLDKMLLAYLVSLIPFFAINGLLTGMATSEPVVWYNQEENMGSRLVTIPFEDFIYNFSLLFTNLLLYYQLMDKYRNRAKKVE